MTKATKSRSTTRARAATVDDYIARFEPEVQSLLREVRRTVRQAAPRAGEVISYSMPALKQNGILVFFAAFKNHIGFYPPIRGDAKLERRPRVTPVRKATCASRSRSRFRTR